MNGFHYGRCRGRQYGPAPTEVNHKNMKTTFILYIGQLFQNFVCLPMLAVQVGVGFGFGFGFGFGSTQIVDSGSHGSSRWLWVGGLLLSKMLGCVRQRRFLAQKHRVATSYQKWESALILVGELSQSGFSKMK